MDWLVSMRRMISVRGFRTLYCEWSNHRGRILCAMAACLLAAFCFSLMAQAHPRTEQLRTEQLLDNDWQFYPLKDFQLWPAEAQITPEQIEQLHVPSAQDGWRPVHLPDDYVVKGEISQEPNPALLAGGAVCALNGRQCEVPAGPPSRNNPKALNRARRSAYGGHGYLPLYPAWYRRKLNIPASARGKTIWLEFGGIYRDAIVFVNGKFIEQHPSGYTTFRMNISAALHYGSENTIAVFVDPRWFEGWWYEGGGIYRHVRLIITNPLQVAPWGTFVSADVTEPIAYYPSGDRAAARLTIQTTVRNEEPTPQDLTVISEVLDPEGKVVATATTPEQATAGREVTCMQHVNLHDAALWSLEHPTLYTLRTKIRSRGAVRDETQTSFGIRTLRFDPDHGFFLNGRHVEIYGVASHQGFPGVGIAAPDDLWPWRIRKLKEMGANAYRTAHNPLGEEFYEAADRMGMLVMDETRHLGDTYGPKSDGTTPYSDLSDLKLMVMQHRNHPSIIMWSLANEEGPGRTPYGAKMFAAMKDAVRAIDPTRPTTSAMNGGYTPDGFISVEDLLGMNYHNEEIPKIHEQFPKLMIFGSEDINAKTSRGTRAASPDTGRCSAFGDDNPGGQPWSSWVPVADNPYVAGEFIWTGFDYRGEPNPYSWPAVTSQTGAMDLCGFPKPVYYYWQMVWHQKPSVYLFPDWNESKDTAGQKVRVRVLANTEEVELRLNDRSLGVEPVPRNQFVDWQVAYAPGRLTAIGRNHGHEAARYTIETTGAPASLRLIPEVQHPSADGEEVVPIRVEVLDAQGRVVPDASNRIQFAVSGAGTLAGVANGDPASHENNIGDERSAFRGLCMVLVRTADHPGAMTIRAHSANLAPASITIFTTARKH